MTVPCPRLDMAQIHTMAHQVAGMGWLDCSPQGQLLLLEGNLDLDTVVDMPGLDMPGLGTAVAQGMCLWGPAGHAMLSYLVPGRAHKL